MSNSDNNTAKPTMQNIYMPKKLNGSDVVKYKDKVYSVKWYDEQQYEYFLVPPKMMDSDNLGFWADPRKCTILEN